MQSKARSATLKYPRVTPFDTTHDENYICPTASEVVPRDNDKLDPYQTTAVHTTNNAARQHNIEDMQGYCSLSQNRYGILKAIGQDAPSYVRNKYIPTGRKITP